MNRIREYRGWCPSEDCWQAGLPAYSWGNEILINNFEVTPESIGQLTGLFDKNGVKIFEGDIIKDLLNNKIGTVIFRDGFFGLLEISGSYGGFSDGECCQIIGNTTEHPHLLEVKVSIHQPL